MLSMQDARGAYRGMSCDRRGRCCGAGAWSTKRSMLCARCTHGWTRF